MSFMDKLGFDFDKDKFGNSVNLTPVQNTSISNSANNLPLKAWQINDLKEDVDVSSHYINPCQNLLTIIGSTISSLKTISTTIIFNTSQDQANTLNTKCILCESSIQNFTNHTNKLSGKSKSSNVSIPDMTSALRIGKQAQIIIKKIDGEVDNSPVLGCFTSLYINYDLGIYSNNLIINLNSLNATINSNNYSNATISFMNGIINNVNSVMVLMDTRVEKDIDFFNATRKLVQDVNDFIQNSPPTDSTSRKILLKTTTPEFIGKMTE